jgi:hypothetical protein
MAVLRDLDAAIVTDAALPVDAARPDAAPDAAAPRPDAAARRHLARRIDAAPRQPLATVRISSTPWASVRVIGSSARCQETPCELQLAAGHHRIELVNPVAGLKKVIEVDATADEPTIIHEVLRATTP